MCMHKHKSSASLTVVSDSIRGRTIQAAHQTTTGWDRSHALFISLFALVSTFLFQLNGLALPVRTLQSSCRSYLKVPCSHYGCCSSRISSSLDRSFNENGLDPASDMIRFSLPVWFLLEDTLVRRLRILLWICVGPELPDDRCLCAMPFPLRPPRNR